MDVVIERISGHPVVIIVACVLLYTLFIRLTTPTRIPKDLPWVGKRSNRLLSETWACLTSIREAPKWLGEGYEKVCLYTLTIIHYWLQHPKQQQ